MSKSNSWENALLLLMFNNSNVANVGDATGLRGSTVAGSLYISLHTADPGEAGDQTTNEIAYTGYARVAVARSGAAWTVHQWRCPMSLGSPRCSCRPNQRPRLHGLNVPSSNRLNGALWRRTVRTVAQFMPNVHWRRCAEVPTGGSSVRFYGLSEVTSWP